jgi:hypothetical protein
MAMAVTYLLEKTTNEVVEMGYYLACLFQNHANAFKFRILFSRGICTSYRYLAELATQGSVMAREDTYHLPPVCRIHKIPFVLRAGMH